MRKPEDFPGLSVAEERTADELEEQIDRKLDAAGGEASIEVDQGRRRVWIEVAGRYEDAGWSVLFRNPADFNGPRTLRIKR
jgi:hypothetical protein